MHLHDIINTLAIVALCANLASWLSLPGTRLFIFPRTGWLFVVLTGWLCAMAALGILVVLGSMNPAGLVLIGSAGAALHNLASLRHRLETTGAQRANRA